MHEHGEGRVDDQGGGDLVKVGLVERPDDAHLGLGHGSVQREFPDGLLQFLGEAAERHCAGGVRWNPVGSGLDQDRVAN